MNASPEQPIWAVTPEKLGEAVRRLVQAAQPRRIILFGSRARGDAGNESDVDLLVVKQSVTNRFAEMVRLQRVLRGLVLPVELLVIGESEYADRSATAGTVYHQARQEGKVLYESI